MIRHFRAPTATLDHIRVQVRFILEQPNSRADEPWKEGGTFNDGVFGYVAINTHHYEGPFFGGLIDQMAQVPGVEEITEESYAVARPMGEIPDIN